MGDKEAPFQGAGSTGNPSVPSSAATLYVDSVKAMAESVGISNLQDDAAKELAEDVTYRLKCIIQDAQKFMELGRRVKLNTQDIDHGLKVRNVEVCVISLLFTNLI